MADAVARDRRDGEMMMRDALSVERPRGIRISGDRLSPDYWRLKFDECPVVTLNGIELTHVTDADSGHGRVRRELHGPDGKLLLANVVLDDGTVIDKIIAYEWLRGAVQIIVGDEVY